MKSLEWLTWQKVCQDYANVACIHVFLRLTLTCLTLTDYHYYCSALVNTALCLSVCISM